ncbi:beta-3 adrenergic receptor [Synchiropus splendidus]|uniref:beta-3 adrenergic receptor n=1 Tax=Synchiropus splendidus TaxID=270530 RepID=UPI00237D6B70|nr:beta-3 adrenergic receptor [Synchiropus splendidus]
MDIHRMESGSRAQATAVTTNLTAGSDMDVSPQTRLLLEVLMVLMCLGAVTGNTLVIVIIAATKSLRSVTSVLIMNLAVSDLLVGVAVMPFVALSLLNNGWWTCKELCLYVGYTSTVYCTASVLTLAAIALDRYHSIMDCLRYSSRCTLWRTSSVVLWIWLQALATSCPPLLSWSSVSFVVPMYSCAVNWAVSPSYTASMVTVSYFLPAAVILFCYVRIIKVARGHARRIHTLEDSARQSRHRCFPAASSQRQGVPSKLVFHVSGRFVSDTREDSSMEQSNPSPRPLHAVQSPVQSSQQHHHGLLRLFLVIVSFFLCWTPYIGVALVQAAESALSAPSGLIPSSVVTYSYWLLLLNSDINPLLYALLSKRFQGALRAMMLKLRAGLGGQVGADQGDHDDDPCTLTLTNPGPPSTSESFISDDRRSCSPMCTDASCKFSCTENSVSTRLDLDFLRVPPRAQEGSRLPFSALTKARRATFYFGNITVRVEHDIC